MRVKFCLKMLILRTNLYTLSVWQLLILRNVPSGIGKSKRTVRMRMMTKTPKLSIPKKPSWNSTTTRLLSELIWSLKMAMTIPIVSRLNHWVKVWLLKCNKWPWKFGMMKTWLIDRRKEAEANWGLLRSTWMRSWQMWKQIWTHCSIEGHSSTSWQKSQKILKLM